MLKYIDQKGVIHEVKKNQVFPDRGIWISEEQQWRYFKWDKKANNENDSFGESSSESIGLESGGM